MIKPIEGYEDTYAVSDEGYVINILTQEIISPWINNKGYLCVDLHKNGKRKHMLLHRLIAMAFVDNPYNYPIVLHLDNNKLNVKPSNLRWGTYSENNAQAIKDGLNTVPRPDNRKRFAIINCDNIIHCYGQKEVLQYIGYGNISTVHNLIHRKSTIKNGKFKGYQVQRFEDVKMCEIVNK